MYMFISQTLLAIRGSYLFSSRVAEGGGLPVPAQGLGTWLAPKALVPELGTYAT